MAEAIAQAIFLDDLETVSEIVQQGFEINKLYPELGFQWKQIGYGTGSELYEFLGPELIYGTVIDGTALHYASFYGREEIVKYLLSQGALTDIENSAKETARAIAGHTEHHDIVKLFKYVDQDNVLKKNKKMQQKKEKKSKKKEKSQENKVCDFILKV
jgi:hypothetical protein